MPITSLISNSEIKIDLPNIPERDIIKIQYCIVQLLNQRFFNIGNGKVIMYFKEGDLMEIWTEEKKWTRKKEELLTNNFKRV